MKAKEEIAARHEEFAGRYAVSVANKLFTDHDLDEDGPRTALANALANAIRQAVLDGALRELELPRTGKSAGPTRRRRKR